MEEEGHYGTNNKDDEDKPLEYVTQATNDWIDRIANGILPAEDEPVKIVIPINPMIIRGSLKNRNIYKGGRIPSYNKAEVIKERVLSVIEVPEEKSKEFVTKLDGLSTEIKDFFVEKISPIEFAFGMGVDEATQMLELMTDNSDVSVSFNKVRDVFKVGIDLHILDFLLNLIGMDKDLKKQLLDAEVDKHRLGVGSGPASGQNTKVDPALVMMRNNSDANDRIVNILSKLGKQGSKTNVLLEKLSKGTKDG